MSNPVFHGQSAASAGARPSKPSARARPTFARWLLVCGVASSVLYLGLLICVPLRWPSYDSASFTVSELSAIGAPTRALWLPLALLWSALYGAFGVGVWRCAGSNRALRAVGALIVLAAAFGAFWPPMHSREVLAAGGGSLTDTLHLVWAAGNGVLTLLAIGFSAAALGRSFRRFATATVAILVLAGLATSASASRVAANLPTPWMGLWERVNIVAWLLWVAVLALALLARRRT